MEPIRHLQAFTGEAAHFESLFKTTVQPLHAYAYTILRNHETAEEVVQEVFCRVWEKQLHLKVHSSIRAYLFKAVYHESLNHLKHRKVKKGHEMHIAHRSSDGEDNTTQHLLSREAGERIRQALEQLPEQCRTIFQLSRFEGLKYQQIASALNISVKTVENQMGKALRLLRKQLIEFLPILLYMLFHGYAL